VYARKAGQGGAHSVRRPHALEVGHHGHLVGGPAADLVGGLAADLVAHLHEEGPYEIAQRRACEVLEGERRRRVGCQSVLEAVEGVRTKARRLERGAHPRGQRRVGAQRGEVRALPLLGPEKAADRAHGFEVVARHQRREPCGHRLSEL